MAKILSIEEGIHNMAMMMMMIMNMMARLTSGWDRYNCVIAGQDVDKSSNYYN
jgi:hypothetical protein